MTATDLHRSAVDRFAAGWDKPGPHAWDDLVTSDVVLNQPLVPASVGRAAWADEVRRLLVLVPDLRGSVDSWAGRDDLLFIELTLSGTLRGSRLRLPLVDKLWLDADGMVTRRDSFFDPGLVAALILRRPRSWLPWWRSGVGPFVFRRRLVG
ncbi:nuclear transport factor 2 family protein [Pseudonocardia spinosispora]|uniref:nuclear transport factor 2 family protein n=1 Tax=Pseudonocardia spinosispora TaxID=103441 RepID=UPI0004055FA7|nr:nuclear transport factor 2 family protein [Pseudonocardia spinosispora]